MTCFRPALGVPDGLWPTRQLPFSNVRVGGDSPRTAAAICRVAIYGVIVTVILFDLTTADFGLLEACCDTWMVYVSG